MDPATRLRRHSQLWETGSQRAQRIALGSVIFAIVILLNVIEPYWENETNPNIAQLRADLQQLEREQDDNKEHLAGLKKIETTLDEIKEEIRMAPWSDEIQVLVEFCRGGCPANTRPKANTVINDIADELHELIVVRLRTAIAEANMTETFAGYADTIEKAISDWRDEKQNIVWYKTLLSKRLAANEAGTIVQLSAAEAESKLGDLNTAAANALRETTTALQTKQEALDTTEGELQDKIRKKDELINAAMDRALPDWATGLFTPERMVAWYPWILSALAAMVVANGFSAGRHFRGMADAEGWSAEERRDPLLSTPWTLTARGGAGSAVTALYYAVVIGVLTFCLLRSLVAAEAG